jgi:hypothetical protein
MLTKLFVGAVAFAVAVLLPLLLLWRLQWLWQLQWLWLWLWPWLLPVVLTSFRCHPERSEGPRRIPLPTTLRAFQPIPSDAVVPAVASLPWPLLLSLLLSWLWLLPLPLPWPWLLSWQVSAVILSAAKDPEEINSPQLSEPFSPYLPLLLLLPAIALNPGTVIPTEAAHTVSSAVEESASQPQTSLKAQCAAPKDSRRLTHYLATGIFKKSPTPSADRVNRDE